MPEIGITQSRKPDADILLAHRRLWPLIGENLGSLHNTTSDLGRGAISPSLRISFQGIVYLLESGEKGEYSLES